jgi:ribosomal protein S18 acetylase RimI-like enzyme
MVYSVGVASEEKAHSKFCQSRTSPVDFKSSKSDKVVWEGREEREMIVHLPHTSMSAAQRNMWEGLKGVVDETMGFYDGSEDKRKVCNCLYIKGNKVVGLLVVEPIEEGYPIVTAESVREGSEGGNNVHTHSGDEDEALRLSASPDGGLLCTTTSRKAVLGVSQVWVHDDYRRQGIASKLLTSARNHFIYGYHIPVDKIAFTQPTPAGRLFAEKYTATKGFLVYNNSPGISA